MYIPKHIFTIPNSGIRMMVMQQVVMKNQQMQSPLLLTKRMLILLSYLQEITRNKKLGKPKKRNIINQRNLKN